jgi:hypothetical protein
MKCKRIFRPFFLMFSWHVPVGSVRLLELEQ